MQASLFNEIEPDEAMIDLVRREVSELSRHADPNLVSWQSVKSAFSEAANSLRTTTGQTTSPVLLPDIAQLRRIHSTKYFNRTGSPHGVLVPTADGFLVRLPNDKRETRNRSSMAHEIGHTFFYDLRRSPPTRLLARPSSGTSYKEEQMCKWFARELLMPRELVAIREDAEPDRQLDLLFEVADKFVVSPEFAAVRLLWDLECLPLSIGLFSWFDSGEAHGHRVWKYYGRRTKSRRKAESTLLKAVERVLIDGPPFDGLSDIAGQNTGLASIEWKVVDARAGQSVSVLLTFLREGVSKIAGGSG